MKVAPTAYRVEEEKEGRGTRASEQAFMAKRSNSV